jgi:hypothetical protein
LAKQHRIIIIIIIIITPMDADSTIITKIANRHHHLKQQILPSLSC